MIITVEDIRKYREIATNTQRNRVEIFIRETEQLDIIPLLGVAEYDRLNGRGGQGTGFKLGEGVLGTDALGGVNILTKEELMLLNGGQYMDARGCRQRFMGLKAAESYLVFSRFIKTHPLQVTPYGVVVKEGDDSSPASAQSIQGVSKDSEKIGRQYLADAIKFWRYAQQQCCNGCTQPVRASKRKYYAIGE